MTHDDSLSTAQTWLSRFHSRHPDEIKEWSGGETINESSTLVGALCSKDPERQIAGHNVEGEKRDQQTHFENELGDIPKAMLNDTPSTSCGSPFGMVEVRFPKHRRMAPLATVPETPEEDLDAGVHSKPLEDQDLERFGTTTMDWRSRSRIPTVSIRELEPDVSPTNADPGHFCTMIESMSPEVEEILCQYADPSRKSSSSTLGVPKEAGDCGSPDRQIEIDAVMWSPGQHDDDPWQKPTHSDEKPAHGPFETGHDELVIVGAGVQILEDSTIGGAYGVPVTKASVEVARRDSGIKFTLTCVEDGYEDAEVLFDDDFLYEEEMMDPDYFRKKDGCVKPTSRPALIRISTC
ncbi:phosphoglucosamine mutase [Diplodia corticola]|uniref:Phosphoglucosamine mutase n=1 Tax=Diplodia corticola TaxID=236234 RepID=A0A1J9S6V8_9PEZI|nr:phosphoglucosamine mutase [Diplodia corticola]OJD35660.1 phosphoglucosamine mutase [Diplodia corticola]